MTRNEFMEEAKKKINDISVLNEKLKTLIDKS